MDITTINTTTKKKQVEKGTSKALLNAFIYPISKRQRTGIYNPYIDNFIHYSDGNCRFLNKHDPSGTGIFHLLKYINNIDILFLNWIEKLPDMKGGFVQTAFLMFLLSYCKRKKIKIVWTMHNNVAHSKLHLKTKKFIFKTMVRKSDLIITHCKDGISIVKEHLRHTQNVFYFPHPVNDNLSYKTTQQEYDILIWGALTPYKGIDVFLEFLQNKGLNKKYLIKIIGKCQDSLYYNKLNSYTNNYISIQNIVLGENELKDEMRKARIVLFTYSSDSVLSSGALAESVSNGALVIGPYKAAFKDLADMNYILCYENFESLIPLLDQVLSGNLSIPRFKFAQFIKEFHWSEFSKRMYKKLNTTFNAQFVL